MKKFFFTLLLFFTLHLSVAAKTGISFIYVNGSNINNQKIYKWYIKGIKNLHPCLKCIFEKDPFVQEFLLKNGDYFIQSEPVTFFWGDGNYNGLSVWKKNSFASKGLSNWFALQIRQTCSNVLHDVIWSQKRYNMNLILDNLHSVIKCELQKGNKVILYGYSSGSLIAYEYLLARSPYINVSDLFNALNVEKEYKEFVCRHPKKDTCMSALKQDLTVFSEDGHIIIKDNFELFKKNYMNLDKVTDDVCIPEGAVNGLVNLASPMVLFNSDVSEPTFQLTYYNRLFFKYILEHDMFWVTINYHEDPLSFPNGRNLTANEMEYITGLCIEPHSGFIYDKSDTRGGILAMTHMAYLSKRKSLAKAIVRAYVEGYKYQCENCRKKNSVNCFKNNLNLLP